MRPVIVFPYLLLGLALSVSAQNTKSISVELLGDLASYPQRSAPATVISLNQPLISAEVSARLQSFPALVGNHVTRGEVLALLDCRELQLGLDAANAQSASIEARLALAESRLQRSQSLIANQLLSQDDLESSRTELDALNADLLGSRAQQQSAQLRVDRCSIRAPFDALVLERHAQVGQWLSPGTPVVAIQDVSRIEISAQIFTADAELLDQSTRFEMEANGRRYPVQLRTILDAIDPMTRNREARFEFSQNATLVGAAGRIVWRDSRPHLPPELLIERNGKLGVFIASASRAEFIPIVGAQPGRSNPVSLGLDSAIVTDGYLGLLDGDAINIREP